MFAQETLLPLDLGYGRLFRSNCYNRFFVELLPQLRAPEAPKGGLRRGLANLLDALGK